MKSEPKFDMEDEEDEEEILRITTVPWSGSLVALIIHL